MTKRAAGEYDLKKIVQDFLISVREEDPLQVEASSP